MTTFCNCCGDQPARAGYYCVMCSDHGVHLLNESDRKRAKGFIRGLRFAQSKGYWKSAERFKLRLKALRSKQIYASEGGERVGASK